MCLYPTITKNRKYTSNEKNGGIIPAVLDERTKEIPYGCGRCIECKLQKSNSWKIRLWEEIKTQQIRPWFVTLTISNENLVKIQSRINKNIEGYELDNETATEATRIFLEHHRYKTGKSVRHWLITELGHEGTENIHLHGIIWYNNIEEIRNNWQHGWIFPRPENVNNNVVNNKTINYITKYVTKMDLQHLYYNPKILCSKGIGSNYINKENINRHKFKGKDTIVTYKTPTGHEMALPTYYRNKLWTETEREKLWIQLLDTETRYIRKEKVSIKNGLEQYNKLLKYHQLLNKELGYGTNEKDWDREQYENEQRKIMNETRKSKALAAKAVKHEYRLKMVINSSTTTNEQQYMMANAPNIQCG